MGCGLWRPYARRRFSRRAAIRRAGVRTCAKMIGDGHGLLSLLDMLVIFGFWKFDASRRTVAPSHWVEKGPAGQRAKRPNGVVALSRRAMRRWGVWVRGAAPQSLIDIFHCLRQCSCGDDWYSSGEIGEAKSVLRLIRWVHYGLRSYWTNALWCILRCAVCSCRQIGQGKVSTDILGNSNVRDASELHIHAGCALHQNCRWQRNERAKVLEEIV